MNTCVVVGGGISGLTAAILLKKRFNSVYLIEQSENLGGLLACVRDNLGNSYDQGTHIPEKTGIAEIDEILFDDNDLVESWYALSPLKTGNYFAGEWDNTTQTIDASKLPRHIYQQGIGEFMTLVDSPDTTNIERYISTTLGPTFYQHLSKPIIHKLYGKEIDCNELAVRTGINYFGASRIKAFDKDTTKTLKQLPFFDHKLGFHSAAEYDELLESLGQDTTQYYYPKGELGAQTWVNNLAKKASQCGVKLVMSSHVVDIKSENKKITQVTLNDGSKLACDLIYWSAPPIFALKAANLEVPNVSLSFRTANLLHYTFNEKPLNDNAHYVWNWDPISPIFRITLYHNIRQNSCYQLTAEVLSSKEESEHITLEKGLADLKTLGLISDSARVLSSLKQTVHNTFPIPTHAFANVTQAQFEQLTNSFDNFILSGRFSGRCWLQNDVLKLAYQEINQFCAYA
ncbi:NAD(P)-binding protein [Pseudoalteromonas sp.]|uniref:NAD(P)-binding protein n=1 Tax=Pseudoalteromonas sp. TaxID=53249 RepID=UPI0035631534